MTRLDNTVALVTGAGQGIGQGIAFALADSGAAVAVAGRTESKLKDTVAEIERRGGRAIPVACDVTDADQISEAIDQTVSTMGGLNVLVNNAQEFNFGTILDIPLDLVDVGWRSGPLATLLFMRAAYPHLRGGGVVVNVSSGAAVDTGIAGVGAYSAAKSAIESLSRAAAVEWADDGIRVNTVIPLALTPSVQAVFDMNPGLHEHLVSAVPLGRFGDAERDIGPAVAFLAGPDAGFITGTTLSVDGGSVRLR
jgi:meso-butanediol dehydrogenase/(S,S)-butanediol dehydrogenase/diacetyl reductase